MKYISIDIETTGIDPKTDQILEIGAIIEDTNNILPRNLCPQFHTYVYNDKITGSINALIMNHELLKDINNVIEHGSKGCLFPSQIAPTFWNFLNENSIHQVIAAGKNFSGFDKQFLNNLPGWNKISFSHRVLDPMMLFIDFKSDEIPPDMSLCKKRANLDTQISHRALDDAWDVIKLLRTKY